MDILTTIEFSKFNCYDSAQIFEVVLPKIDTLGYKRIFLILLAIFVSAIMVTTVMYGCTGFILKAKDDTVVFGRSLEWGECNMKSNILVIPRGRKYTGTAGKNMPGLKWSVKYWTAGMNMLDMDNALLDGINEKGLYAGGFFFPGFADYTRVTNENAISGSYRTGKIIPLCIPIGSR